MPVERRLFSCGRWPQFCLQPCKLLNVVGENCFRTRQAIMVPPSTVSHLQAPITLFYAMPSIGLAIVGLSGRIYADLDNQ